jgi:hypothetical protein
MSSGAFGGSAYTYGAAEAEAEAQEAREALAVAALPRVRVAAPQPPAAAPSAATPRSPPPASGPNESALFAAVKAGATKDVAALLRANGFGQYADALSSLTGVKALTQTEAQLRALGVAEGHVQPLLALFAQQER